MFSKLHTNYILFIFLGIWLVTALLQSYFMDLSGEEAYYFLFSQRLDWGYMDHPPMIALVTKLGYFLFNNNLGARLLIAFCSTATLFLVYKTYDKDRIDPVLFCCIAMSLIGIHAGSFLIKTDVPLIFFEALFFWGYKKYLSQASVQNIIVLIIAIAGMLLSKYHGILIVFFVILSKPALCYKRSFWFVVLGVSLCMLPHAYWQYMHDWTSIRFHLQGRADMGFQWKHVLGYIVSQPIVLGPLAGFVLLPLAFLYRTKNDFERALRFTLIGVLLFFLVNSFRVYIHKHWTSVALLPMMILGGYYVQNSKIFRKIIISIALFTMLFLLPIRLYLAYDFVPDTIDSQVETLHNWKVWGAELDSLAAKKNVVFVNSYENASRYTYLTGKNSHCLSTYYFNNTHFDHWAIEDTLQGSSVLLIDKKGGANFITHQTKIREKIKYRVVDNYRSYAKVKIRLDQNQPASQKLTFKTNSEVSLPIHIENKQTYPVRLEDNPELPPQLGYYFMQNYQTQAHGIAMQTLQIPAGAIQKHEIKLRTPNKPGKYQLRLGVQPGWIPATINSPMYMVTIVD